MSNFKEHARFGMVVGAASTIVISPARRPAHRVAEALGGAIGGRFGAALPDILEPATSPRHRKSMHSVTVATAIVVSSLKYSEDAKSYCRRQSVVWSRRARLYEGTLLGAFCLLIESLWHAAAGFFVGAHGGYVSHLLLDAQTPSGLPLL